MDKERTFRLLKPPILPLVESDPDVIDLSSTSHDENDSHITISDSESEIESVEKTIGNKELKSSNAEPSNKLHVVEHGSNENKETPQYKDAYASNKSTDEITELDNHFEGTIRSIGVNVKNLLPVEKALSCEHISELNVDKEINDNRSVDPTVDADFKNSNRDLTSQLSLNESIQKIQNERGTLSSTSTSRQESLERKKANSFISDIYNGLSNWTAILNYFAEDRNNTKQKNSKDSKNSLNEIQNSRTNSIIIDENEPIEKATEKNDQNYEFSKLPKLCKTPTKSNPQEVNIISSTTSHLTQPSEIVVDSTCSSSNQPISQSQSQSQSQVISQLPTQTQRLTQTQLQTQVQAPPRRSSDTINEINDSSSNITMTKTTKDATKKNLTPLPKHPPLKTKNPSIQLSPEKRKIYPENLFATSNLHDKQANEKTSTKLASQSFKTNDSLKVASERDAILKLKIPRKSRKLPKLRSMKLRQRAESTDDESISEEYESDNNIRPFRPSSGKRIISNGLLPISTDKISKFTTSQAFTKEEIGSVDNLTLKSTGGLFDDDDKVDDFSSKDNIIDANNNQQKLNESSSNRKENTKENEINSNNIQTGSDEPFELSKRSRSDRVMNFDAIPLESSDYENDTSVMMGNLLADHSPLVKPTENDSSNKTCLQNSNLIKCDIQKLKHKENPVIVDAFKETEKENKIDDLSQATQSTAAIDGLLNYYENEYFNCSSETEIPGDNNYKKQDKQNTYSNLFVPEDDSESNNEVEKTQPQTFEYADKNNDISNFPPPGDENPIHIDDNSVSKKSEKNKKFSRLLILAKERKEKSLKDYNPYSDFESSSEDEDDEYTGEIYKRPQQFVVDDDDAIDYESEDDSGDNLTKVDKIKIKSKAKIFQYRDEVNRKTKRPRIIDSDEDDQEGSTTKAVTRKRRDKKLNILKDLEFSDNEYRDLDNLDRKSRRNKNSTSQQLKKEPGHHKPINVTNEKPNNLKSGNVIILDSEPEDETERETKITKDPLNQDIKKSPSRNTSAIEDNKLVLYKTLTIQPTDCIHCMRNKTSAFGNACNRQEPCNNCITKGFPCGYTEEGVRQNIQKNIERHKSCLTCQRNSSLSVKKSCNGKEPCNNCRELNLPCGYTREGLQKKIDNGAGYNRAMKSKKYLKKKKFNYKGSYDSTLLDNMNEKLKNRHKQKKK